MNQQARANELAKLTCDIVSAYVSGNQTIPSQLPALITETFEALHGAARKETAPSDALVPAIPVKKSISADHVSCLECGREYKSLKRHLRVAHDLGPQEYRDKWNLSPDHPIVAPSYSKTRSKLAQQLGLGKRP